MRKLQRSLELLIRKAPFGRLVREVVLESFPGKPKDIQLVIRIRKGKDAYKSARQSAATNKVRIRNMTRTLLNNLANNP
jgi:histone H3/H4